MVDLAFFLDAFDFCLFKEGLVFADAVKHKQELIQETTSEVSPLGVWLIPSMDRAAESFAARRSL